MAAGKMAPVDVEASWDTIVREPKLPADVEANVDFPAVKPTLNDSGDSESTVSTNTGDAKSGNEASSTGSEEIKHVVRGGIFRSGGTVPSAICMSKATLGAGILSLAAHGADVGCAFQLVALALASLCALVSMRMIAAASVSAKRWSYEDINEELFHPAFSFLTGFISVCKNVGANAAFLIVCGQVFQVLSGVNENGRKVFVVGVAVLINAPLSLVKSVSFMRHLALVSVFALLLLVATVIWFFGMHGPDHSVTRENFFSGHGLIDHSGPATFFTYLNAFNSASFAYTGACLNVPQLMGEMKPVKSLARFAKVTYLSSGLTSFLYVTVSIFGILAFGFHAHSQRDSLILDLYPERRNFLVQAALIAVMFSVITCFQFHMYPIKQFAAFAVRKIRGREAEDEKTDRVYGGMSLTRWFDIASALSAVFVIVLIATATSTLRTILDFLGAFATAFTSYVVPPLWIIQVRRRQPGFTWCSLEVLGCLAFFALGVFLFSFGSYAALSDAELW